MFFYLHNLPWYLFIYEVITYFVLGLYGRLLHHIRRKYLIQTMNKTGAICSACRRPDGVITAAALFAPRLSQATQ